MAINSCNAVMGKHLVAGSLSGELMVADGSCWTAGSSLDGALADICSRLMAEETARAAAVTAEAAARVAADNTLQANIDSLSGSARDDRAAIRSEFASADASMQAALTAAIAGVQADVDQNELDGDNDRAAIRGEFAAADSALETSLLGGASASHNTLKKIEDLLNAEVANRIADVDAEETRALAAEAALQTALTAEETARIAAVAAVQADVDQNEADGDADRAAIRTEFAAADATEAAARISGDAAIDARLGSAAGFRVVNTAGDYAMHWGAGKPRMELTLDGSGGVDVCFSVQP